MEIFKVKDREEMMNKFGYLFKEYDFYCIAYLSQLKNKNNTAIIYVEYDEVYWVVTSHLLLRKMEKIANKK